MTVIKLGICLTYFNDKECLGRLLKSIKVPAKYKDNVMLIAIDGQYRGYDEWNTDYPRVDAPTIRSSDGSYELIEQNATKKKVRTINTATPKNIEERHKRQQYVDIAKMQGCDFIIIIDSDEWFEVLNWQRLFEELQDIKEMESGVNNVFTVHCVDVGNDQPQFRKRLWTNLETVRYADRHWRFSIRGIVRPIPSDIIQIYHDSSTCRSAQRQQKQRDYESRLESLESS
jgi:glycosyltransferase involved in cell wall biosynthesis